MGNTCDEEKNQIHLWTPGNLKQEVDLDWKGRRRWVMVGGGGWWWEAGGTWWWWEEEVIGESEVR